MSGRVTEAPLFQLAPEQSGLRVAADEYLTHKRKRLSDSSYRGYSDTLKFLVAHYPALTLAELEPPAGTRLLEDFLAARWGERAGRTYNKHLTVLRNFCQWHFAREGLRRDPTVPIENAREAEVPHDAFSAEERSRILAVNHQPREQIALRLLLDYGLRKGSLLAVRLDSFDEVRREVQFWMKGDRYHTVSIGSHDAIWRHLRTLLEREPGHHYLMYRQVLRRRRAPDHESFLRCAAGLQGAHDLIGSIGDKTCAFELARSLEAVGNAAMWLRLAAWSASRQVVREHRDEPMGTHPMHDLWYFWLARAGVVARGVTHGQRIHKARKTAGQRVLETSGNLTSVQTLLGHQRIATTETYVKASAEQVRADIERTVPGERLDEDLLRAAAAMIGRRA